MDNINYFIKNLFIQIKQSNTSKPSFVWNYFGRLYRKPSEAIDLEKHFIVQYVLINLKVKNLILFFSVQLQFRNTLDIVNIRRTEKISIGSQA